MVAMTAGDLNLKDIRQQFTENHWRECGDLLEETFEKIQSSTQARQALKDLAHAGCNPAVVLHEISLYCGGWGLEFWDKQARYARAQIRAIAARLENDADILERIVSEFMEESADQYAGALHSPAALRQIARSLKMPRTTLTKHTHGKTGTTKHLVYLSYHIKAATNRHHYVEIAKLLTGVDAVRRETSPTLVHLAEAIRREIRRHEKQHPELFAEEKPRIARGLAAWRHSLSSGRTAGH
jgi:hypothetical protein